MKKLDELEALDSAATPAPWEHREHEGLGAIACADGWVMEGDAHVADYALTAAARNALSALLSAVRAAEVLRRHAPPCVNGCPCAYCVDVHAFDLALAVLR